MEIAVCIATYQRSHGLRRLLESLVRQSGLDGRFGVIIVDNDPSGSAEEIFEEFKPSLDELIYAVEPEPGIPAARNLGVALARSRGASIVAFIDDDEAATEYWLSTLVHRLENAAADAVSGPVEPIFPGDAPDWVRKTRLFNRSTFADGAELTYASTSNAMLRLDAIAGELEPFDPGFRFSGGSDTMLFLSLRASGKRIVWEPNALVYEFIPETRISIRWLTARSYRHGITLARCERLVYGNTRRSLMRGIKGALQIPAGAVEIAASKIRHDPLWRNGVIRIARGVGTIAGLFGATYEEYGRTEERDDRSVYQESS
ncbi:MAG: glycosyltransferase family 2 protein [Thermomicrobiaceae bacterium]